MRKVPCVALVATGPIPVGDELTVGWEAPGLNMHSVIEISLFKIRVQSLRSV